jgi:hypothetical protein
MPKSPTPQRSTASIDPRRRVPELPCPG